MDRYQIDIVVEKERQIEETMDKIRQQLAEMRQQDAILRHQVTRMKRSIENVAVEIRTSAVDLSAAEEVDGDTSDEPFTRPRTGSADVHVHPKRKHKIRCGDSGLVCEDDMAIVQNLRRRKSYHTAVKLSGSTGSICSYASSTTSSTSDLAGDGFSQEGDGWRHGKRSSAESADSFSSRRHNSTFTSLRKVLKKIQIQRKSGTSDA